MVWLLLGERQGDNAQVLALGRALTAALGWSHDVKQIHYDPDCPVPFKDRGATLTGVDTAKSAPLLAPWPDVVIAIGRRAAPVSRWLKEQTGGRLMNVHLGRPRMAYRHFDLIFTTPQYGLPPAPNVIQLTLPITMNDEARLESEAAQWAPQLAHLPRPWTALFIGGPTTLLRFDRAVGQDLLERVNALAAGGGSLLVTTSPRTPDDVASLFDAGITQPHVLHRWSRDGGNPYRAFLQLADRFIVTSDSVSMIAEAADRVKPIHLFEVPRRDKRRMGPLQSIRHRFRTRREKHLIANARPDLIDSIYDAMTRFGHARPRRSIAAFDRALYEAGIARPLQHVDRSAGAWNQRRVPAEERELAIARIRDTFIARQAQRA